jgi:DNA recombination protein RmuC
MDASVLSIVTVLASVCAASLPAWLGCALDAAGGGTASEPKLDQILSAQERLERSLRQEQTEAHRQLRTELAESSRALRAELAQSDNDFRAAMARDAAAGRTESAESLNRFAMGFSEQLQALDPSQRASDY